MCNGNDVGLLIESIILLHGRKALLIKKQSHGIDGISTQQQNGQVVL